MLSNVLANSVNLFHILVIIFMIVVPFTESKILHVLHAMLGLLLILHWVTNEDACSLTTLEGYLRGIPASESFIGQFVRPLFNVTSNESCIIIYIFTGFLTSVSLSKLLSDPLFIDIFSGSGNNTAFYKFKIFLIQK